MTENPAVETTGIRTSRRGAAGLAHRELDVVMLAVTGGLQHTAQEYESLLAMSGFHLEQVIDTPAGISIVEAATR